jgi:hypothetical protein
MQPLSRLAPCTTALHTFIWVIQGAQAFAARSALSGCLCAQSSLIRLLSHSAPMTSREEVQVEGASGPSVKAALRRHAVPTLTSVADSSAAASGRTDGTRCDRSP